MSLDCSINAQLKRNLQTILYGGKFEIKKTNDYRDFFLYRKGYLLKSSPFFLILN